MVLIKLTINGITIAPTTINTVIKYAYMMLHVVYIDTSEANISPCRTIKVTHKKISDSVFIFL